MFSTATFADQQTASESKTTSEDVKQETMQNGFEKKWDEMDQASRFF